MAKTNSIVERPAISCEITPKAVFAARAGKGGTVDVLHSRSLPDRAVVPSLTAENILDRSAVRTAVSECIAAIGGATPEITAVIPDAATRVVLLEFESLPARADEAEPVVRYRLKKSLPFDIEKAALSYAVIPTSNSVRVVAVVTLRTVLDEYESAFREAGCEPGVVIPSTLAALGLVDASRPTMLLKVDSTTTSVAIVDQNHLLLFRTLESGGEISPERLAEDVYPSIVYLQDTYGVTIDRVLLAGVNNASQYASLLSEQTGSPVEEITRTAAMPVSGARADASGVIGALL